MKKLRVKELAEVQKSELSDPFALLVDAVQKYGIDNISQISRQTGIPIETVRYKIKKQLPSFGINVRLRFDEKRLGLQLIFAELQFAKDMEGYAQMILPKLSDVAFLTYHARELSRAKFSVSFAVPYNLVGQWKEFLNKLITLGILQDFSAKEIRWRRVISVNPKYFDFTNKRWRIDISLGPTMESITPPPVDLGDFSPDTLAVNIDRADVLIIKEMQKSATQQLSKTSRVLGINEKTIGYHYRKHIRKLTPQTLFAWVADSPDERGQVVLQMFVFDRLTHEELEHCRRVFNSFPFTWAESGADNGFYSAEVVMPQVFYSWSMHFLRTELANECAKLNLILLDVNDDASYTIAYELFSQEKGGWFFDERKAINEVMKLLPRTTEILSKK